MEIYKIVEKINKELDNVPKKHLQKKELGGRTTYGYKPQIIIDMANKYLRWEMEVEIVNIVEVPVKDSKWWEAAVKVKIKVYLNDGVLIREQYGGSRNASMGDALKGATTDGLGKVFSLLSIGSKAYLGELGLELEKPSEKQLLYMKKLAQEKGADLEKIAKSQFKKELSKLTKGEVSTIIDILQS